jgi:hypothetical protein
MDFNAYCIGSIVGRGGTPLYYIIPSIKEHPLYRHIERKGNLCMHTYRVRIGKGHPLSIHDTPYRSLWHSADRQDSTLLIDSPIAIWHSTDAL